MGKVIPWWRNQMETFSALLTICAGNSPVPGELPTQRPVTQRFGVFFDLGLNKRLSKQSWGWWFETPSRPLWRHGNVVVIIGKSTQVPCHIVALVKSLKIIWNLICADQIYGARFSIELEWLDLMIGNQDISLIKCHLGDMPYFVDVTDPRYWFALCKSEIWITGLGLGYETVGCIVFCYVLTHWS